MKKSFIFLALVALVMSFSALVSCSTDDNVGIGSNPEWMTGTWEHKGQTVKAGKYISTTSYTFNNDGTGEGRYYYLNNNGTQDVAQVLMTYEYTWGVANDSIRISYTNSDNQAMVDRHTFGQLSETTMWIDNTSYVYTKQ